MHGMVPKCDNKHPEWPIATLNMHGWYMVCKTVARQPQYSIIYSTKHGEIMSIDRTTIACKNTSQERGIEASGVCDAQTEKYPSTTLMRDQKYAHLQ